MIEQFKLKNGEVVTIKFNDSSKETIESYIDFIRKVSKEHKFTNQYAGQPDKKFEDVKKLWESDNFYHISVVKNGDVIGEVCLKILQPNHPWGKYRAGFGILILKEYWGQGLGRKLLEIIEKEAKRREIHKLEGEVRSKNKRAIELYLKMGFEIEGILKEVALIDGKWRDNCMVGKIL